MDDVGRKIADGRRFDMDDVGRKIAGGLLLLALLVMSGFTLRGCSTPEGIKTQEGMITVIEGTKPEWEFIGRKGTPALKALARIFGDFLSKLGESAGGAALRAMGLKKTTGGGTTGGGTTGGGATGVTPTPTVDTVASGRIQAESLAKQAKTAWDEGDVEGACGFAESARNFDPDNVQAKELLGLCDRIRAELATLDSVPETNAQRRISAAEAVLSVNPRVKKALEAKIAAQARWKMEGFWECLRTWAPTQNLIEKKGNKPRPDTEIVEYLAGMKLILKSTSAGAVHNDNDLFYFSISHPKYIDFIPVEVVLYRSFLRIHCTSGDALKVGGVYDLKGLPPVVRKCERALPTAVPTPTNTPTSTVVPTPTETPTPTITPTPLTIFELVATEAAKMPTRTPTPTVSSKGRE